jgi:hypothetical protein
MNRFLAALALACALYSHAWAADADGIIPDPKLSPGAQPTQDLDIICHQKTGERRHTTEAEKNAVYRAYGLKTHRSGFCSGPHGCVIDHITPLECGGQDVTANMFPQKADGPYNQAKKNRLEGLCHKLVCEGKITPAQGQAWFMPDWRVEYDKRFGSKGKS